MFVQFLWLQAELERLQVILQIPAVGFRKFSVISRNSAQNLFRIIIKFVVDLWLPSYVFLQRIPCLPEKKLNYKLTYM